MECHVRVAGDSLSDAAIAGDMKGIVTSRSRFCLHCYLTARDEVCIELPVTIEFVVRLYLTRILVNAILGRVGIEKSRETTSLRIPHQHLPPVDHTSESLDINGFFKFAVVCFSSSGLICNGSAGQMGPERSSCKAETLPLAGFNPEYGFLQGEEMHGQVVSPTPYDVT